MPYIIVWVCISASFEYLEDIEVPTLRRTFQRTKPEVRVFVKSRLVHEPFKDVCLPEPSCIPNLTRCEYIAWRTYTNSKLRTLQHI